LQRRWRWMTKKMTNKERRGRCVDIRIVVV
jgi:hypothetical protein